VILLRSPLVRVHEIFGNVPRVTLSGEHVRDIDLFITKNCQEAFSLSRTSLSNIILSYILMSINCVSLTQTFRLLLTDSKQRRYRLFLIFFLRFKYCLRSRG